MMEEEVNVEEVYKEVAENNVNQEVPVKKSKKWILFLFVGVMLALLIGVLGVNAYINHNVDNYFELEDKGLYVLWKCYEYCPYKEVYTEERRYAATPEIEESKGIKRVINEECLAECPSINAWLEHSEAMNEMDEGIFSKIYVKRINKIRLDRIGYHGPGVDCLVEFMNNDDKTCLRNYLGSIKSFEKDFIKPEYKEVTLNFTEIDCSPEGINVKIDLIEGDIKGLGFIIHSEGSSVGGIEKTQNLIIGSNEFLIKPEEYKSINIPETVSLYYLMESSDGFPSGRKSSPDSTRFCEY